MWNGTTARPGNPDAGAAIFVGRAGELQVLSQKLDAAFAGGGSLAMLAGEPGVGKTFIVREFAAQASRRGALVLSGVCYEGDWQPPYSLWAGALGEYVRTSDPELLRQAIGQGAPPLAQLVPELRSLLPDTPAAPPLSPDEERVRLYDALVQLLLALARESAVVLVLDDLQWADRDSLRALRHLARFVPRSRLLVIGVYRDKDVELDPQHPLAGLLATLHRELEYQRVVVRGFTNEEVAAYLTHWAGQALPQALVQVIHAETNGNPFYIREVFRHLLEERKILQRAGRWSTDLSLGELGIPEGVRRVVERRIAGLSKETGRMLRLAAAFSGGFQFWTLQALLDTPEETLLNCLDEALAAGLVYVVEGAAPRYDFVHAIMRHTLYEGQNPDRRARLHRRIADALERVYAGHELEHAAELAAQYHASVGLPGAMKGIPHALAAAEQARAAYAYERAAAFLRMARELSVGAEAAVRADVLCKLAVAEAEALKLDEARQTVEEALSALAAAGAPARERAAFLARVCRALKDGGAGAVLWQPLVEHGLALCGEERDLVWARLMLLCGRLEPISTGTIGAAHWLGHDALAVSIARESGDEDDYSHTLEALDLRTPEETAAVITLARSWRRPSAILRALSVVGRDLLNRRDTYREAISLFQELLVASERYGSIAGQGEALLHLTIMQALVGELARARQMARQAQETIARLGAAHELQFQERALGITLSYLLDAGWSSLAASASRLAAGLAGAQNPRAHLAGACAALAYARDGNAAASREVLALLTPIMARIKPALVAHHAAVTFAGTAVWDIEAVEYAPTYHALARDIITAGLGSSILVHELTIARMAALLGDLGEARDYFARARAILDADGLRPLRAITDYDEALALTRARSSDHGAIVALLDTALSAFQAIGMEGWVRRALALREKLAASQPVALPSAPSEPSGLTPREIEVLRLLAGGSTNKEVAEALVLSPRTVEQHIAHIYGKIGARGRADATAYALRHGLVGPEAGKA